MDFLPPSNPPSTIPHPAIPYSIKKVLIYGMLQGSAIAESFTLAIWNKNLEQIHSANYPQTLFKGSISWLEFTVPDINVVDKFYIHVYALSNINQGIKLGADSSITNEHSNITSRSPDGSFKIRTDWPYQGGACAVKKNVNWMIRVVGTTYLEPESK